jgi:amino acid adenylation domain-containing protein
MKTWFRTEHLVPLDYDGPVEVAFERFDERWVERPIAERFEAMAQRYGNRVAVTDGIRRFTYAQVRAHVHALAREIVRHAAGDGPVGILLPHNATFPVAALACLAAGRAFVPVDLKYPAARIEAIMREANFAAVILDAASEAAGRMPAAMPRVDIHTTPDAANASNAVIDLPAGASGPDQMAVILYTSGSTGKPKGICNNQRALLQRVAEATNSCHINPDDRILLLSSPGTIAGEREMFAALLNGAALHVTDPQLDGVHSVLQTMTEARITLCYAVPSLLRMLLRLPGARQAFAHLRVVRVGGDITLASDLALFRDVAPSGCRFFASFSSTETPAVFQWFVPHTWQAAGPRVPIGYPRPGIDFAVVGEDGQPAPPGEAGELVVRSRYLALGQWQEGRLVPGPFATDPHDPAMRILHTGDLVRQCGDGLWELFGRKDRQIKIRGQRIDAGEVEAALRSCAQVADVAVIARRSGEEVVALAAFVAPEGTLDEPGKTQLFATLKQRLGERVPSYMHPADIRILETIPQLPGFKPDIRALEALDRSLLDAARSERRPVARPAPAAAAATGTERVRDAVRYAWSIVLGAKSYEADQSWDETNGDSLKAIELWFYIEDKLGFKLPLDAVDENTRPSGLIKAIDDYLAGGVRQQHAVDSEDAAPLVCLFPGIQDDDPALARFRAAFGAQLRFHLIDYPLWRETAAANGSFASIIDAVTAKILAEPPCEVYRLAGYSFGGVVAYEVAQRLLAQGRRVAFVGLLDTRRWDLTAPYQATSFHTFLDEQPNWKADWLKAGVAGLIRAQRYALLDRIERLLMARAKKLAFWFRRRVTRELRYQAFLQWRPAPLAAPLFLYYSEDRWPGEPSDFGWSRLCASTTLVPIGGDHATVIQPPQLDRLQAAFLEGALTATPTGAAPQPASAEATDSSGVAAPALTLFKPLSST